jgi:hypothetical protein
MRKFVIAIEITIPDTAPALSPKHPDDGRGFEDMIDIDLSKENPIDWDWDIHSLEIEEDDDGDPLPNGTIVRFPCQLLSCQEIPCTTTPSPAPSSSSATV